MVDRFKDGFLTPGETASHLDIPRSTLRAWLEDKADGAPLIHQVRPVRRGQPSMPFIAVAEAYVLRSLRSLGFGMSEIREAAAAARDTFGTPYGLTSRRFATEGVDVFIAQGPGDHHSKRDDQAALRELPDGFHHLIWDPGDDFPCSLRLWQYPESVPVVIDPRFGHGRPVVAVNRVPVKAITDLWEAGETVEDIAHDFGMTPAQVSVLCRSTVLPVL